MAQRLKVFRAQMGFHEAIVAAPSRKAALAAWGTRQDLFGEGMAFVVDEPKAIAAALAQPGAVLRRPAGSKGAFEGDGSAAVPKLPKPPPRPKSAAKVVPKPQRKPADRSRLDAAGTALREAKAEHEAALGRLARERAAVDARELDLGRDYDAERRRLEREADAARKAFDKADGRDADA